jgi:hypothetical protein
MKKLTKNEKERIEEIYSWGYFMDRVINHKADADGNTLSDETILKLIDAEENVDLFSDYKYDCYPCETCGTHGSESVIINDVEVFVAVW